MRRFFTRKLKPLFILFLLTAILGGGAVLLFGRVDAKPQGKSTAAADPLGIVLTPLNGDGVIEQEIRALQKKIAESPDRGALLERLGWAFVAQARLMSDPGFYTLAEQAGKAIATTSPDDPAAALLLGHVYDAQHRFAEAEEIARALTAQREFVFDYALLGDTLMEQGNLNEAVGAYQKMVDLKPCLQTYSRVAHMRWLKGDLPGAIAVARLAVSAGSPREPEASAWACTRLALYEIQAGDSEHASANIELALQLAPDYAPALLMRGKLLMAQQKFPEATVPLTRAATISPLPEYLWTLVEALQANGENKRADQYEIELAKSGATSDPRTFAVYLSSRRENAEQGLRLATAELETRKDIFTYDALAWAQLASGRVSEARESSLRALAEGTQDARLFYHAGAIAAAAGDSADALRFLNQAHGIEQLLLPSERQALGQTTAAVLVVRPQLSSN